MITNNEHFFEESDCILRVARASRLTSLILSPTFNHTPRFKPMLRVFVRSFSSKTPEFYAAAMQKHQLFATIDKEAITTRP